MRKGVAIKQFGFYEVGGNFRQYFPNEAVDNKKVNYYCWLEIIVVTSPCEDEKGFAGGLRSLEQR